MQLFSVLLVAVVMAVDGGLQMSLESSPVTGWYAMAVAVVPTLLLVAAAAIAIQVVRRAMDQQGSVKALRWGDRIMRLTRSGVLVMFIVSVVMFEWLTTVRHVTGDLVLLDEILVLSVPIGAMVLLWVFWYPIERRMREAVLIRQLDMGGSIRPLPTRGSYVLWKLRTNVLLLLVPLLLIVAASEIVEHALGVSDGSTTWIVEGVTIIVAASIFTLSPLVAKFILGLKPLPEGELRTELLLLCKTHSVKVREIMLWQTGGSMINAAVMGIVAPLRYIMLTDTLLEVLNRPQVLAVMAHEIGHVRRRHIPWFLVCFVAIATVLDLVSLGLIRWVLPEPNMVVQGAEMQLVAGWGDSGVQVGLLVGALVVIMLLFGWISRRFERQADTFASQHFALHIRESSEAMGQISEAAVVPMATALARITEFHALNPRGRSWRHGSIAWRQGYLESLVGKRADALPIDRTVRRIKLSAIAVLFLALVLRVLWTIGYEQDVSIQALSKTATLIGNIL
ncbi:MAG: M48 family metallopeptidase [Phycisphaerales bacterium]|nr:M48 family metallopeptidase [Phycisphaerales bacterium]